MTCCVCGTMYCGVAGAWGKYASVECGKIDASASAVDLLLKFHGGGSSTIEFAPGLAKTGAL